MWQAARAGISWSSSCSHLGENPQRENLFDDPQGFHIALDTVICKLIRREPFLIETAETGLVAEERAVLDPRAAREQFINRAVKPDKHSAALSQQRDIFGLSRCASAEREDARLVEFDGLGDDSRKLLVLQISESGLAQAVENFGNGEPAGF